MTPPWCMTPLYPAKRPLKGSCISRVQERSGRHERDVRQCLGKIPEEPLAGDTVQLGQLADVVSQLEHAREHSLGVVVAAEQMETLREPERADEEGAFARREAVVELLAAIASDEPVLDEIRLDRLDRRPHALLVRRKKTDERQPQQAGIDLVPSVDAREAPAPLVEALRQDVFPDLVAEPLPRVDRPVLPMLLDRLDRSVDSDPGHDLGVDEVLSIGSYFPDAVVGISPVLGDELNEPALQRPGLVRVDACAWGSAEEIHQLAVLVELELLRRSVSDADGP